MRKTRNPLLQMDEAHQAQLAEWLLDGMPYHIAQPQTEKEFGVKAGKDSFSTFWQEVCVPLLLVRRRQAVETADAVATEASSQPGRFDQATIDALKQRAFELSISPHADPKDVKSILMLVIKARDQDISHQQLQLDRAKFARETCEKFLLWYRDEQARAIAESTATNEEKIRLLRQTYFADVDALEKSGALNLPS
jgi:hypothetical protein